MMKKLLLKSMLIAIGIVMGSGSAWAQTTTLLEYGTSNVPWTSTNMANWTGKTLTLADDASYVSYTGTDNSDFSNSVTISPTSGNIINLTAVWRGRSNTGRYWSNKCGIYFRFGNIVVAQNDQDKSHGYVFNGLDNLSSVTKFTAGTYRTDIESLPWLLIEAEINTATNTLTSFTIKSEDGATTYVSQSNISLTDADYTTVAFGFQRGGSHSTSKQEQLKSVKITETTQDATYANYTVHFVDGDGATVKEDVTRSGEVGTTVNANTDDQTTFYSGDYKYVYNNDGGGVEVASDGTSELTVTYTKYGKYTYNVYAVDADENQLATLATASAYEDESATLTWSKYIQVDDKWYSTSSSSFKTTVTEGGAQNVVYNTSDVAYFYEMESLTRSGGAYLTETADSYSNGTRLRLSRGSLYYTPALAGGVYTLNIPCQNSNSNSNEVYVYTRSSDGTLSDVLLTHTATSGYTTINLTLLVPDGYSIAFNGNEGGSSNNNCRMDYMTLTKLADITNPDNIIGAVDYSTAYYTVFSESYDIASGETYKVKLQNHSAGTYNYQGFNLFFRESETDKTAFRVDYWDNITESTGWTDAYIYSPDGGTTKQNLDWDIFKEDMKDAYVELELSYDGTQVSLTGTATNGNNIYYYNYAYTTTADNFRLSVDGAWIELLSVEKVSTSSITKTFPDFGYATFSHTAPVTVPDGVTVYTGKATETSIVLTEVEATVIPANTGVIIRGTGTVNFVETSEAGDATAFDGNELIPTSVEANQTVNESGYYGLSSSALKFIKVGTGVTFSANKAYIKGYTDTEAKSLSVTFGDDATAIENIEVSAPANVAVYNLSGQKVDNNYKGIIIKNGKKYLNK